jgi:hypothetical protein
MPNHVRLLTVPDDGRAELLRWSRGQVTPDQMQAWFAELGLDRRFLSSPIHPVDAFEKITRTAGSGLAICWTALSRRRGDAARNTRSPCHVTHEADKAGICRNGPCADQLPYTGGPESGHPPRDPAGAVGIKGQYEAHSARAGGPEGPPLRSQRPASAGISVAALGVPRPVTGSQPVVAGYPGMAGSAWLLPVVTS